MNWYLDVLKKYAQFNGRARRKEYWFFALFSFLISFVLAMAGSALFIFAGRGNDPGYASIGLVPVMLYSLAVFIPGLAVSIRRLHDSGKSGWLMLLALVPFIGGIIILVFMLQDSQPGPNMYGPNPKGLEGGAQWATAVPPRF